ncbi:TPA: hypothetical protein ACQ53F_002983 [Legionella pneumophila]
MTNVISINEASQQAKLAIPSHFEFNQQAKALKKVLESSTNFPNNLRDLTDQDTQDLLSRIYGFESWNELGEFVKKTENYDLISQHISYISDCFIYLANVFQEKFSLDGHLFKNKDAFSDELIECSRKIKEIANAFSYTNNPSKKVVADICDLVIKYCYCFIATKKSSQYNEYISSLYEAEFLERLSQFNPYEGLNNLEIKDLQFLMTYKIKSTPHVYLLNSTRELSQGNESLPLLQKVICMLVFCMSKYNNGHEMPGVPNLSYYGLQDLCKPYCIDEKFYDVFDEKNYLNFSSYQTRLENPNTKAEQLKLLLKEKSKQFIENKKIPISSSLQIIAKLWGYPNWQTLSALSDSDDEMNLALLSIDYIQKYLKYSSTYVQKNVDIQLYGQGDEIFFFKEELVTSLDTFSAIMSPLKQHYMHRDTLSHDLVRLLCHIVTYYLYYYICSFISDSYDEFIDDLWSKRDASLIKDFEPETNLSFKGISKLQYFISDRGDLPNLSLLLQATREFREGNKSTRMMNKVICLLAFCMMHETPSSEYDLSKRPMDLPLQNAIKKHYFLCDWID